MGLTTIAGGTLQLGNGASSSTDGSLAGNVTDNAALIYNLAGSQTYSGAISGSGGLTKIGVGALTLVGANSYSGSTAVGLGLLAVASTAALPGYNFASKIFVGASGTLTLNVGGSGWAAGDIASLVGSNGSGFASGSVARLRHHQRQFFLPKLPPRKHGPDETRSQRSHPFGD